MKRLSLIAVSMLLTCTLFAADIFLRGSVNSWGASDDFKFSTSDNVVYTLEKSFDLFGEFKFADAAWGDHNYGSGGTPVALDTELSLAKGGGNFNCGTNSFKVTKIVLDLSKMTATITGQGGELEIKSHTVVGESTDIFGTAWDPTNTANDMVKKGDTWTLTKENVSLSSGTNYDFKIVANHAWGIKDYPEDNSNASFSVSESGSYDVNFEYNETTNTGKGYATKKSEPTTFDTYILVGDKALFIFDWMPSPIGTDLFTLETTDGIHYTKTVNGVPLNTAGTFAYGFSKNGSTTDVLFKEDRSHTVTVEAATYNISVVLTVVPGEEPEAEAELTKVTPGTVYYIAGNGTAETDWCCGLVWNEKGCPMEDGYYTRDLPAGTYEFKITDGTWDNSWGYSDVDAAQSTAGYKDNGGNVAFTLEKYSTVAVKFDGSKIVLQWTAKDEPVPPVQDTWTLVGDMPPFPVAWTAIPAFDLQTTDGVIYTLVADDVDMPVETFQYGFVKNHDMSQYAPLEEKYTAKLTDGTGNYKVEITIDFSATPVVPQVEFTKNVAPVVYDYYIAGDGSAETGWTCGLFWQADGCGMTDGAYAAKVPAGTYSFKVTQGDWDKDSFGYESVDATASTPGYVNAGGNVQFTVSAEANIGVTFNGTAIVLTSDVPFGEATIKTWTIAGQEELMGVFWDPKVESNDMAKDGDVYKLTRSNVSLAAGEYQYKACANHSWNIATVPADDSNMILAIDEDGVYTVVFTLDADKAKLSATATKQVVVFDTWTLVGDMPPFPVAWTAIPAFDLQTTDGVIYTLVADDVDMPVETFQYGFVKNHDMSQYAPLEEKYTAKLTDGTGNYKVEIRIDFTDTAAPDVQVTFTKNPEPPVGGITVNVTVPANTPACFFYGDMSGNTFVEMTKVDDTHYTTKFADKESIGWGYLFCWEADNWSTKDVEGNFTDEPVDGVINVVVSGWLTEPGTSYKYTTYTDWKVKSDWNGDWDTAEWLTLTQASAGVFEGTAVWGTGPGVNVGSESGPVKKDWYPAGDPSLTIASGLVVGQEVKVTLTVVDDENVKISVTPEGAPTFDTWTLVGDMPPFPVAWTAIPAFDLTTTDGVVYTMTAEDVEMAVETFQYGFRKNHTEEYAPLAEKYTAKLTEGTGNYKVEIKLDFTDATAPDVQVEFTKNPEPPVSEYYIAGNGSAATGWCCGENWNPAGCGMTGGVYNAKVPAGTYSFKVTNGAWEPTGKSWGYESVDETASTPGYEDASGNVQFTVASEANISVSFDGTSIVLTSDVPFGEATIDYWTVVGDAEVFGTGFDPSNTDNDMTFVGGVYQLVKTGLTLEAKTYGYKFTANHQWGVKEFPEGMENYKFDITEDGKYKVTFSLNPATGDYSAIPEKEVDPGFDRWTLVGDMPPFPFAWTVNEGFDLQTTDGIVYTLVAEDVDMTVDKFEYGFRKNNTAEYAPLAEKYTATLAEGTGSYKVEITIDFSATPVEPLVVFTKNPEPPVGGITVNVTVPANTPACFFYGDMSGNTFVEMTKVDATHYTTKFADKESIGWGYLFCWEADNWSTKDVEGNFTDEPVDGVINVVVSGWLTEPGAEYKYTTYTDWKVKSDWNGDWDTAEWLTLTQASAGVFEGTAVWGTGPGVNVGSESGPIKKDWFPAGDPALTIEAGLTVGQDVKITLTVVDDENVTINVASATPTSADEAVEDTIYAANGTVYCNAPFEIYNLVGINVTAQNGSLNGVFIVKTEKVVKTVLVK